MTTTPSVEAAVRPLPSRRMTIRELRLVLRGYHLAADAFLRDAPLVELRVGPGRFLPALVYVRTPAAARDVLSRRATGLDKQSPIDVIGREMYGPNVFNVVLEEWQPRRRTLQPLFTRRNVDRYGDVMSACATDIASGWGDGVTIDANHEMRRLTLRVLGRSLFGVDLDERAVEMQPHIHQMMEALTHHAIMPSPLRWLLLRERRAALASRDVLNTVIEDAMRRASEEPNGADLIQLMREATDPETGARMSDADVRDELRVFLLAGHDTTATTMTAALWHLGRDLALQERTAAEVKELGDRPLTTGDVSALPFLAQVLYEAMRLHPPAPMISRTAITDVVVDGHRVREGSAIGIAAWTMHRDPSLWEHPLTFDPERFAPERSADRDRWQYLPFGAGPRSCIGEHFAMTEAILGLGTLLQHCRVASVEATFPTAVPFTLTAEGEIPVRIHRT